MLSMNRHVCFFEMIAIKKNRVRRKNVSNTSSYSFELFMKNLLSDDYRDFAIIKHVNDESFEHSLINVFEKAKLKELGLCS